MLNFQITPNSSKINSISPDTDICINALSVSVFLLLFDLETQRMKQRETDIVLKKLKNTNYNFYWNHNGTKYKSVMLKTEMYSVLSG